MALMLCIFFVWVVSLTCFLSVSEPVSSLEFRSSCVLLGSSLGMFSPFFLAAGLPTEISVSRMLVFRFKASLQEFPFPVKELYYIQDFSGRRLSAVGGPKLLGDPYFQDPSDPIARD